MKNLRTAALAAMAVAGLAAAMPAAAERATMSGRVEVADLNLGTPAGQATFRQRVRFATEIACGDSSRTSDMVADLDRCRTEMRQDGEAKLAALLGDPSRTRVTVGSDAASQ